MNKIFLASFHIFTIFLFLFAGYWLGTNENFYNEAREAVWEWCEDANNFTYCNQECSYLDEQCLKQGLGYTITPLKTI